MGSSCTNYKNSLNKSGQSQLARFPDALSPEAVKIDGRKNDDFINFANDFAKQLIYFNTENKIEGNWQDFFSSIPAVIISGISKAKPAFSKNDLSEILQKIEEKPSKENYLLLLSIQYGIIQQIDSWYRDLPDTSGLKLEIFKLIKSGLSDTLKAFIENYNAYLKFFSQQGKYFPIEELSDVWGIPQNSASISTIYEHPLNVAKQSTSIFKSLYKGVLEIIRMAPTHLEASINGTQENPPHFALYLTFIKLFGYLQEDINLLSKRHLDFYYTKILKFTKLPAVPDKAHVLLELTKNTEEWKLPSGIIFKAGKDAIGKKLNYRLKDEIIVDKAKIASLKSLYVKFDPTISGENNYVGIYQSPVPNSQDGWGAPFQEKNAPSWRPFGNTEPIMVEENQTIAGIAIADEVLLMNEGVRNIVLAISSPFDLSGLSLTDVFNIHVTGKKGWIELSANTSIETSSVTGISLIIIRATLDANLPAVFPYNPKLYTERFPTNLPVLKLLLNPKIKQANNVLYYGLLKKVKVQEIQLAVNVTGVKTFTLKNDFGPVDSTKPFFPFGPFPVKGSSFEIGGEEINRKLVTNLNVNIEWQNPPSNFATYYTLYKPDILSNSDFTCAITSFYNGTWSTSKEFYLFADDTSQKQSFEITNENIPVKFSEVEIGNATYIKFELGEIDFGHNQYPKLLGSQMLLLAGDPSTVLPNQPYTPVIKSIELDYQASASPKVYFQLDEFNSFSAIEIPGTPLTELPYLLPQYNDEGTLYIGLKDFLPPANLNLLFQVAEDSADTSLLPPQINWYYLSDNSWKKFEDYQIPADYTNGLLASGVITLAVPEDATNTNTLLEAGLHWVKVSVKQNSAAVCNIVGIHAQAAETILEDHGNDPGHYNQPLPKNTISKLVESKAEIKSVIQPYTSFGGQPAESDTSFYTRVSERLRHKGRAISINDYEKIVLQQFKEIFKVRCINHTKDTRELAPGTVTLAVIPDMKHVVSSKRLSPQVNLNKLNEVALYVSKVTSPFVKVLVLNPYYEPIRVKLRVKYKGAKSSGFYNRLLNEDIKKFLSPWAFEDGVEINFGGKISKSSIIDFVDERDYVEYITDVEMYLGAAMEDVNEAETSFARSILVSAESHDITAIEMETCTSSAAIEESTWDYLNLEKVEIEK